jgi:hypothetical protein
MAKNDGLTDHLTIFGAAAAAPATQHCFKHIRSESTAGPQLKQVASGSRFAAP